MTYQQITESYRKTQYWRGFRSAMLIAVPVIIILLIACNVAVDALIK